MKAATAKADGADEVAAPAPSKTRTSLRNYKRNISKVDTVARQRGGGVRENPAGAPVPRRGLITIDPDDPRLVVDGGAEHPLHDDRAQRELPRSFIENVLLFGVLEPCLARVEGDKLELIDGRFRVRAARAANEILRARGSHPLKVPIFIRQSEYVEAAGVSVSCNEIRVTDSPTTKARKAQKLINTGLSQREVAVIFGVSQSAVQMWLKALKLTPELQAEAEAGRIGFDGIRLVCDLPKEEQVAAWERIRETMPGRGNPRWRVAYVPPSDAASDVAPPPGSVPSPAAEPSAPPSDAGPPATESEAGGEGAVASDRTVLQRDRRNLWAGEGPRPVDGFDGKSVAGRVLALAHFLAGNREVIQPSIAIIILWLGGSATGAAVVEEWPTLRRFMESHGYVEK